VSAILERLLQRLRPASAAGQTIDPIAAAAATLFLEVAWADHDLADAELEVARRALAQALGIGEDESRALVEAARPGLEESVGLQAFTRELVEAWSAEQRFDLLVGLWRLALVDSRLDRYEEATIRRIADLLYVSHARFIEAKQAARRALSGADPRRPPRAPRRDP
jgi:uncharacterized tellurite resistance protein B-like protein